MGITERMEVTNNYRVRNETPKRLNIKIVPGNDYDPPVDIILPPLGETMLTMRGEDVEGETLAPLSRTNYLAFKVLTEAEKTNWERVGSVLFAAIVMYGIVGTTLVHINPTVPWLKTLFWPVLPLLAMLVAIVVLFVSGFGAVTVQLFVSQAINLLLVLVTGVGLTAATIWYFGNGWALWNAMTELGAADTSSLALLGRVLQLVLISIVSLFPALLYFLFDRYRLGTLREIFEQNIFRLDPNLRSLTDVRAKYGRQLDELYGHDPLTARGRQLRGTRWPIWVCTLVITIGWIVTLQPIGEGTAEKSLLDFLTPNQSPIVFAFLGAYYFAVTSLSRRYTRGDLRPKAYSHIVVRIFIVVILAWVIQVLIGADSTALAMSFVIGVVPDTFWTAFNEFARNQVLGRMIHSLKEKDPLTNLEGIDLYDRARLAEEGVTNVESFAHHDLIDLILATRIPIPRLVDWLDQSVLYLHLSGERLTPEVASDAKAEPLAGGALRQSLRMYGIRTATEFIRTYEAAREGNQLDAYAEIITTLKPNAKLQVSAFQILHDALADDEWIAALKHWRKHIKVADEEVQVKLKGKARVVSVLSAA
jgi:hypothetical protein